MSSLTPEKGNFDKNPKKSKITTINLDITSSSSSSSSSSSIKSSPFKNSNQNNNKNNNNINHNNKISPPKIKQLFSDSDEDENQENEQNNKNRIKNRKNSEDLTYGFEKALNKKQFQGEKGKMLLRLQNTYVNDSRFKLDSKFKNDINYSKLPPELKDNKNNNLFNYEEIDKEAKTEDIELEKKKNMSILAEILPNSAFLEHKSIDKPINKLIIKRFDPKLKLGNASVEAIKVEKKIKKEKEKNLVKLEKGVQIFNDRNDMEMYNKYNDIDKMKKREKEKLYNDTINRINDEMNQEIIVNYDSWKKGILEKADNNFSLFGQNNTNSNNNNNNNNFSLFGDNNNNNNISNINENSKNDDNKNANKTNDADDLNNNNNILNKKVKSEKEILRKKKKREKEKLRRKEKERIKKAKIQHKKEKNKRKMEAINEEYKEYLINEIGEEKANNHLRYIDMIQQFKEKKKK